MNFSQWQREAVQVERKVVKLIGGMSNASSSVADLGFFASPLSIQDNVSYQSLFFNINQLLMRKSD